MSGFEVLVGTTMLGNLGLQKKAFDKQEEAAEVQQNMNRMKARREKIQALRESQIKRAMVTQQAASTGTIGSSGFEGGVSSLQSQLGSNLSFANQMSAQGQRVANLQQGARGLQASAALGQQIQQAAVSTFGGGFGGGGSPTSANQAIEVGNNTSSLNASYLAGGGSVA